METYASLRKVFEGLSPTFVQCHKSFLVNLDEVAELQRDWFLLKSGVRVPVGQKRRRAMKDALFTYLESLQGKVN